MCNLNNNSILRFRKGSCGSSYDNCCPRQPSSTCSHSKCIRWAAILDGDWTYSTNDGVCTKPSGCTSWSYGCSSCCPGLGQRVRQWICSFGTESSWYEWKFCACERGLSRWNAAFNSSSGYCDDQCTIYRNAHVSKSCIQFRNQSDKVIFNCLCRNYDVFEFWATPCPQQPQPSRYQWQDNDIYGWGCWWTFRELLCYYGLSQEKTF